MIHINLYCRSRGLSHLVRQALDDPNRFQISGHQPTVIAAEASCASIFDLESLSGRHKVARPSSSIIILPNSGTQISHLVHRYPHLSGYLVENEIPLFLKEAITQSLNQQPFVSPMVGTDLLEFLQNPVRIDRASLLSKSELRVLKAAKSGATNKQIAKHLHISPNTIHSHCRNIYRKLGARGKIEAIQMVFGWSHNLISVDKSAVA